VGKTTRKTHDEFMIEVINQHGDNFEIIDKYKNNKTKLRAVHKICGNEIIISPKGLIKSKIGCHLCSRKLQRNKPRLTNEEFVAKFYTNTKRQSFELLSKYTNSREKVKVRHITCGTIFYATGNNLLTKNSGCPKCKESKGESLIAEYLTINRIPFEREVSFEGCEYKAPLKFDFVVNIEKGTDVLIEFDGEQHFIPKSIFGGEIGLKKTQKRDKIKNGFCDNNGLTLVRIPYYEIDNIEEILNKKLKRQEAS
jgi:hypothetical protein